MFYDMFLHHASIIIVDHHVFGASEKCALCTPAVQLHCCCTCGRHGLVLQRTGAWKTGFYYRKTLFSSVFYVECCQNFRCRKTKVGLRLLFAVMFSVLVKVYLLSVWVYFNFMHDYIILREIQSEPTNNTVKSHKNTNTFSTAQSGHFFLTFTQSVFQQCGHFPFLHWRSSSLTLLLTSAASTVMFMSAIECVEKTAPD